MLDNKHLSTSPFVTQKNTTFVTKKNYNLPESINDLEDLPEDYKIIS